jgi:hypothetical protein
MAHITINDFRMVLPSDVILARVKCEVPSLANQIGVYES